MVPAVLVLTMRVDVLSMCRIRSGICSAAQPGARRVADPRALPSPQLRRKRAPHSLVNESLRLLLHSVRLLLYKALSYCQSRRGIIVAFWLPDAVQVLKTRQAQLGFARGNHLLL
ncbi:hypothetical protein NDU88_004434 [Pleurodeles waltl]|uniref:Secreted protein n=1 Tax=Pleurodeles waltl TaxID=8319 RepID=A0AAV7WVN4_PLEWA|nr:hypothetical protein NDU88_004434 [Pleurodeles waltl]